MSQPRNRCIRQNDDFLMLDDPILEFEDDDIGIIHEKAFVGTSDNDSEPEHLPTKIPLQTDASHLPGNKANLNDVEGKLDYDIIVVGSGVAGLYTVYKLLCDYANKRQKKIKILILEQADRIGGRLYTDSIPSGSASTDNDDVISGEEGAMRFCYNSQVMPNLVELIKLLGLDNKDSLAPFPMRPEGTNIDSRRLWFNGNGFTQWYAKENPKIWSDTFYLQGEEINKSPGQIFQDVYTKILHANYSKLIAYFGEVNARKVLTQTNEVSLRELENVEYWYHFRRYFQWEDNFIYNYSMKSLLATMGYSNGCIIMLSQAQGFTCYTEGSGNAGVILQMTMTHEYMVDDFRKFRRGYGTLIKRLREEIDKKMGDNDWLKINSKVLNIKRAETVGANYKYQVVVHGVPDTKISDKPVIYKLNAKKVVLAIPQHALKTLLWGPRNTPNKDDDDDDDGYTGLAKLRNKSVKAINSVTGVRMTKINLYFNKPWWNWKSGRTSEDDSHGKLYGPNTTNLAIGQVYTFYKDDKKNARPSNMGESADEINCMMTIYCDESDAKFWADLQGLGCKFSSMIQDIMPSLTPASMAVVKEILRELRLLFNNDDIPYPLVTTYTSWDGTGFYPVAIHQWDVGVDDKISRQNIIRPFGHEDIFVCNEAWSQFQGWVEGSLESVKRVIDEIWT